jgi:hypothetical protein
VPTVCEMAIFTDSSSWMLKMINNATEMNGFPFLYMG